MKNRLIVGAIVLVLVFLAGFAPQYVKNRTLESELQNARRSIAAAGLRDLAAMSYFQAMQKNYGLAAGAAARYFNRLPEVANQMQDPARQQALHELLSRRDSLTAELARGDAGAASDLQDLFLKTRQATGGGENGAGSQ